MSNKKYGVWEQPKDGSANGCWTTNTEGGRVYKFATLREAVDRATTWNAMGQYSELLHEARELPEDLT
jgi:hypothetical protein